MKINKKKKKKKHSRRKSYSSDDDDDDEKDDESSSTSSSSDEEEDVVQRKKGSDSDSDLDDEDAVMDRLPENTKPLLEFASASQGILLVLVLKQHLKNLYGFSDRWASEKMLIFYYLFVSNANHFTEQFCLCYSKIQKYSPTESAKVYDKTVNRKSKVHFNPSQTLDYLRSDLANTDLSYEAKKNIAKQYLDVSFQYTRVSVWKHKQ